MNLFKLLSSPLQSHEVSKEMRQTCVSSPGASLNLSSAAMILHDSLATSLLPQLIKVFFHRRIDAASRHRCLHHLSITETRKLFFSAKRNINVSKGDKDARSLSIKDERESIFKHFHFNINFKTVSIL